MNPCAAFAEVGNVVQVRLLDRGRGRSGERGRGHGVRASVGREGYHGVDVDCQKNCPAETRKKSLPGFGCLANQSGQLGLEAWKWSLLGSSPARVAPLRNLEARFNSPSTKKKALPLAVYLSQSKLWICTLMAPVFGSDAVSKALSASSSGKRCVTSLDRSTTPFSTSRIALGHVLL